MTHTETLEFVGAMRRTFNQVQVRWALTGQCSHTAARPLPVEQASGAYMVTMCPRHLMHTAQQQQQ